MRKITLLFISYCVLSLATYAQTEICNGIDDNGDGLIDTIKISGLKLYLPFNGNAKDASGKHHNGTVYGATLAADKSGKVKSAYSFNGTDARIDVADHADLRPQSLTLSAWVFYKEIPTTIQSIVGKGYCSGWSDSYSFWFENGLLHAGLGYASYGLARYDFTPPAANEWHHLVLTFDNAKDEAKVYIDSVLSGTYSATFDILYEDYPLMVGSDWDECNLKWYFQGKVDEVMLFNRALNANEVKSLYEIGPYMALNKRYYEDNDGDGYGNPLVSQVACNKPSGYVTNAGDCDDNNAGIHPGAAEICNGVDDDCDGLVDEKLPEGSILYMPFTGNTNDNSGNNNNGTISGGVTLTADRFGKANNAYLFNGSNGYITIPNSTSLQSPGTTKAITQTAWIYLNGINSFSPITMKSLEGTNSFMYRMDLGSSYLEASYVDWNSGLASSYVFNLNKWYFVATTYDGAVAKNYVNGQLIGSKTSTLIIPTDNRPLSIGIDIPGSIEYFNGVIDDLGIYNRALSGAEILNLYKNTGNLITPNAIVCGKPTGLSVSQITATSAKINWTAVPCAASYSLQKRISSTTTWQTVSANSNSKNLTNLAPATTYEYRIKTVCNSTQNIKSSFTAIKSFTTASSFSSDNLSAAEINRRFDVKLSPNPAKQLTTITVRNAGNVRVAVTDLSGKILWKKENVPDKIIQLPIEHFSDGTYLVIVSNGHQTKTLKLVKAE